MSQVENLVFLHGWDGDSHPWQPLLAAVREQLELPLYCIGLPGFGERSAEPWPQEEALLQQLYQSLPRNCVLVGHSLGGMLALRLAARPGQKKIRGMITISANACFVARDNWPGMPRCTFESFRAAFERDPHGTWERFCGLQSQGDKAMRALLKHLRGRRPDIHPEAWLQSLDCLAELDNRALLQDLAIPALYLFGRNDALVPRAAVEEIRASGAPVVVMAGCGHKPHLSQPGQVAGQLRQFVHGLSSPGAPGAAPFDKSAVARSFGRAAGSYDDCAHLQRAVCRQLANMAEYHWVPRTIVDLGSGTGFGTTLLRQHFPQAHIVALDLAEAMLRFARSERPHAGGYIAADAEQLPLADGSVDLVFSSLALQWCYRLPQLFAEFGRVLAPQGHCLVATLGPGTLAELRNSWARVDTGVHVNRFLPLADWRDAVRHGGLQGEVRREQRLLYFDSLRRLMQELKGVGAHNINRAARRGMTGRARLQRLGVAYESLRQPRGLPVSYEVIYLKLARGGDQG
ncbi:malonyl-ACP O-methyltransferase BioC [Microbulbifer spongiae]|uniref:Malonyl-[acyl-carrier protein] O-methyltransferase n=1 Tax=Microbulbifer spongiae TaxID=2944933 RepID=A0ABY9EBQ9_9GAMM|nr:malonyl-ACP O-methyltransferase BioC [Microbulbifer sp. MI-G]WKD50097.1 malonyl-ACP O-methyltransferase BioC [Microbulbifer sp. MI-G]